MSLKKSPWPLRVALGLVALELLVVELRAVAHRRKTASLRVLAPPLAALRTLVHHPEALEYVATTALPANHQLQPADLKVPRGAVGMRSYFPPLKTRVGQYLCADVAAGQRILAENLSATALVPPDPDSYLLELRLDRVPGQPVFQPKTEVTVSSTKSPSATAKGQVLHTSWETAADQKTK